jgi:DNA replication protein DnaC
MTMMSTVSKDCAECGQPFTFESPKGRFNVVVERMITLCETCSRQASADRERDDERQRQEDQRRQAQVWADRRMRQTNIPRELRGLTIDTSAGPAAQAAAAWGAGLINGLVLAGPVGTGKTYLAAAAAWARLQRQSVLWSSVPTLVAKSFNPADRAEVAAVLTAGRKSLVLDDLDKVKPGDWVAAQLFSAIDSRITEGSGLLITTNLKISEIADRLGEQFGEAIASRIAGYCRIVTVHGQDRRLA